MVGQRKVSYILKKKKKPSCDNSKKKLTISFTSLGLFLFVAVAGLWPLLDPVDFDLPPSGPDFGFFAVRFFGCVGRISLFDT